eukprot:scaffold2144_cov215-Pinguiococcus_pyrenoidosus.AAC.10
MAKKGKAWGHQITSRLQPLKSKGAKYTEFSTMRIRKNTTAKAGPMMEFVRCSRYKMSSGVDASFTMRGTKGLKLRGPASHASPGPSSSTRHADSLK